MILKILTHGWLDRFFVLLFWLGGFSGQFWLDDPQKAFLMSVITIITANFILYFRVSMRLVLLTNADFRSVLPNYYRLLKRSLVTLLVVSLLPALTLISQPMVMLSVMSLLLILAVLLVALTYQPKLYFLVIALLLMPVSIEEIAIQWGDLLINVGSFSLPLIALLSYVLIQHIERFKSNRKYIERMLLVSSGSSSMDLVSIEETNYNAQPAWRRWLSNSHFDYYRSMLRSDKAMNKLQLIEVACQGLSSLHRYSYFVAIAVALIIALVSKALFPSFEQISLIMALLSIALIVLGNIAPFQIISKRRAQLKQLASLPLFAKEKSFSTSFISYLFKQQLKLYGTVILANLLLMGVQQQISSVVIINMLLVCVFFMATSMLIMLSAWRSQTNHDNSAIAGFLGIFVVMSITVMIGVENNLALWTSQLFLTAVFVAVGLAIAKISQCRNRVFA